MQIQIFPAAKKDNNNNSNILVKQNNKELEFSINNNKNSIKVFNNVSLSKTESLEIKHLIKSINKHQINNNLKIDNSSIFTIQSKIKKEKKQVKTALLDQIAKKNINLIYNNKILCNCKGKIESQLIEKSESFSIAKCNSNNINGDKIKCEEFLFNQSNREEEDAIDDIVLNTNEINYIKTDKDSDDIFDVSSVKNNLLNLQLQELELHYESLKNEMINLQPYVLIKYIFK